MRQSARSEPSLSQLIAVVVSLIVPIQLATQANRPKEHSDRSAISPSEVTAAKDPTEETPAPTIPDSGPTRDQLILGVWEQERFGRRTLTVLPEGKASMVIEPSGAWTFAFGRRLEAEMFWTLKGDRIVYGMTSGTPAQKYALAVKTWGDHWDEEVTRLTENELVITSDDGTVSHWRRVASQTARTPDSN